MTFRIKGLAADQFRPLFGLDDDELAKRGIRRMIADEEPGFPDRIELRDASPGESLLLLNYMHQPANTPFKASHAIFVREGAAETYDRIGEIPPVLQQRLISLRAFDRDGMMVAADAIDGREMEPVIMRMFAMSDVSYVHAHYAKRGCYAALIERA